MRMNPRALLKILTIALFISCGGESDDVDVSGIELDMSIHRFEKDLFSLGDQGFEEDEINFLRKKYGAFFSLFTEKMIRVGDAADPSVGHYLHSFTSDLEVNQIYIQAITEYNNIDELETELEGAFKRYKHYFPSHVVPQLYTFVSAFNYTIVTHDSLLGLGLDMYLGSENTYYPRLGLPQYRIRNMNKAHMACDAVKGWLSTEFDLTDTDESLLALMIYHGKIAYTTQKLMPKTPEDVIFGYTDEEVNWCYDNEGEVWFHLVDNELLYENDQNTFQKFIGEGPFTPGFPKGSPGKIGQWVGKQIVSAYMAQHPEVSLEELMKDEDAQKILNQSFYKPQKQ